MAVKINIYESNLLYKLQQLGDKAQEVAERVTFESAKMLDEALKESITNDNLLTQKERVWLMKTIESPKIVSSTKLNVVAQAGWDIKVYSSKDNGAIALWINYGTGNKNRRVTRKGYYRGRTQPTYFIDNARKKVSNKIKKYQREEINKEWLKIFS